MEKYYYLLINVFTISVPIIRGFENKIKFFSRWKGLTLGVISAGVPFIVWDIIFTKLGIWGFNPRYLSGIKLINLPIEEWLFFITVPVACIFIYEILIYFIKKDILNKFSYPFSYLLAAFLLILGIYHKDLLYTSITFIATGMTILFILVLIKPKFLGRFYLGYAVSLIPFLIVNGVLTGSFIPDEIVWYNDTENLSVRIFSIPIEDSVYMMLLLIINISAYEWWKRKNDMTTF